MRRAKRLCTKVVKIAILENRARNPVFSKNRVSGIAKNLDKITGDPMQYQNIITIEPGKRSGKPCIRGMRITVYDVLSYLASGMTYEELLDDFPYLTKEDIIACLSYAAEREKQTLVVQK